MLIKICRRNTTHNEEAIPDLPSEEPEIPNIPVPEPESIKVRETVRQTQPPKKASSKKIVKKQAKEMLGEPAKHYATNTLVRIIAIISDLILSYII